MMEVYLDNNATTRPAALALEAARPYFEECYGNPSSPHQQGARARAAVEEAREKLAALLGCQASEIVFTSGGTESNATGIRAALEALPQRRHVITTAIEHPSVRQFCRRLREKGYRLTELEVDRRGQPDLEQLRSEISGDTAVVSAMWANNETGVLLPAAEIGDIAKSWGAMFHVDAVQAPGRVRLDLSEQAAIDYLTVSGHKMHGLKGTGALFVRREAPFASLFVGGEQEAGRRAGTENVPAIVAFGEAARLARENLGRDYDHVRAMRDRLEKGILEACPDTVIHGAESPRLPNTLNVGFRYVDAQAVLMLLDTLGIYASAGSACASGSLEPSYVLQAMSAPFDAVRGSIRLSVSRYTTEAEVGYVLEQLPAAIARLRAFSPFGRKSASRDAEAARAELAASRAWFAGL